MKNLQKSENQHQYHFPSQIKGFGMKCDMVGQFCILVHYLATRGPPMVEKSAPRPPGPPPILNSPFLPLGKNKFSVKISSCSHSYKCFKIHFSVWVTRGGTRRGDFRTIVDKDKRCIFSYIISEKLISGLFEEVCIITFFKLLFGVQGEVPDRAILEQ